MNKNCRLKKSKDDWKYKAKERSYENCQLRKKINRLEEKVLLEKEKHLKEIEKLKCEIKNALTIANSNSDKSKIATNENQQHIIKVLCIKLLTIGVISFRSVPRILKLIGNSIGLTQIPPHFTSVINWTLRAGIGILQNISHIKEPWMAVIYISITIGTRKVLVVKRVLLNKLAQKGKAIDLEDAEVVGIESNDVWNGKTVKSALSKIFKKAGMPEVILKDQGSDLKKGVQLLCEENKSNNIIVTDDVGHYAANALKAEFEKDPEFKKFIKIIATGSSKIRQSIVAWALPPKTREKGRFQGITKLATWAQNILHILDGHNADIEQKELDILLKAFSGLVELKPFIEKFTTSCEIVEQFLQVMKNNGLNESTATDAKIILSALPNKSKVKQRILAWLVKHQGLHCSIGMGKQPLMVSTDIIESLFGKFKLIIQRSPIAELNRLIYIIPLLCGKRTDMEIKNALTQCSHIKMQEFISTNIPTTIRQKRLVLQKKSNHRVPNLGDLYQDEAA